jgi:hypothetical protein
MVQLPVESLKTKWHQLTGGYYIDEFAQSHYKDMLVREALGGIISASALPSAEKPWTWCAPSAITNCSASIR